MLIITAVGPDKPGMAHALAQILFESGCNIEDTTMTRLSGQFSMILVVTPPASGAADLAAKLAALRDQNGLLVHVSEITDSAVAAPDAPRFLLTAYGPEHTGLLARLTGILAQHGVNVTDVQTRVASGGTVYVMLLELELPTDLATQTLENALTTGASDLQISLRELDADTL